MKNKEVASLLYEIADLLEIKEVEWKPRAYRKAAQNIEALSEDIKEIWKKGELDKVPGVGEGIAKKISEFLKTGKSSYLKKLKKNIPIDVEDLMNVPEMGPKTVKLLYKKLKVKNIKDLKRAAKKGKISKLYGMGEKTEKEILEGIKTVEVSKKRFLLGFMLPNIREIEEKLKKLKEVQLISVAGSVRRKKETIHDVDILIASNNPVKVTEYFINLGDVKKVLAKGPTKSSVKLKDNLQVDLRIVSKESYGSALQYLTGSKPHSIKLRKIAIKKGLKLSEYGIFKKKKKIAGRTEKEVYNKLGLPYIEPELREDRGEIEAGLKKKLPKLIGYGDIKGDLHVHSKWSDGNNTIEEMALAAKKLGHSYLCICDHFGNLRIANSLNERRLLKQIKEIDKVNKKLSGIRILKGVEANILPSGKIDVPGKLLKELDIITAGVHSGFKSGEASMTKRIVSVMDKINILNHPTGRLLQKRKGYGLDLSKVFDSAKDHDVAIEINSFPNRLDLDDVNSRAAVDNGVKLVINTDSHSINQLVYMELGIGVARRGWCGKKNVINTLPLNKILKKF